MLKTLKDSHLIVKFKNITLLILLIFSVSCQDLKKSDKPEDLIPESKMIDVLTELSLLHAARNYNKQMLEETGVDMDTYIYEKFDIDSLQFERSNNWYSEQYSQYESIYDSVKNRLQVMKNKLDSLREIEVRIQDSIKNSRKESVRLLDSLKMNPENNAEKIDSIQKQMDLLNKRKDSLITPPVFGEDDPV